MKRIPSRFAATVLLAFYIFFAMPVQQARAHPAIIGGVAVAGAALIVAGGVSYYKPTAPPTGTLSTHYIHQVPGILKRLLVDNYNIVSNYMQNTVMGKYATASASLNGLYDEFMTNPENFKSQYPNLYEAWTNNEVIGLPPPPDMAGMLGDKWVTTGTLYLKLGALTSSYADYTSSIWQPSNVVNITGGSISIVMYNGEYFYLNGNKQWRCTVYNYEKKIQQTEPPVPTPKSKQEATRALQPDPAYTGDEPQPIPPLYHDEIDKYLQGNPNIVHFEDTANPADEDAPPYVRPADATNTPATTTTADPATAVRDDAKARAEAAREAARAANQAVADYKAAHPDSTVENDPVLAGLVSAAADADKKAEAATAEEEKIVSETKGPMPDAKPLDLKAIDWKPLLNLKTLLLNKWPITLLDQAGLYLNLLVRESVEAPSFHLDLFGQQIVVNLAVFDPVARVCRYTIAIVFAFGGIFYIVRRYTN